MVSTGYLPAAVSALSITASVPSSTALATSLTSARVGTGLMIIDSIIWVAVITTLSMLARHADHALLQRRHGGVADLHRQVAARDHDAVAGLEDRLRGWGSLRLRSILAISAGLWRYSSPATLHSWRAISMSVAFFGKLTAT